MFIKWCGATSTERINVGNADGLGHIREGELVESLKFFGIHHVDTINHRYCVFSPD